MIGRACWLVSWLVNIRLLVRSKPSARALADWPPTESISACASVIVRNVSTGSLAEVALFLFILVHKVV